MINLNAKAAQGGTDAEMSATALHARREFENIITAIPLRRVATAETAAPFFADE